MTRSPLAWIALLSWPLLACLDCDGAIVSQDPSTPTTFVAPIGIGTANPLAALDVALTGTGASAVVVPRDTVANRPSAPVNGMIRYAIDTAKLEAYQNGTWQNVIGGAASSLPLSSLTAATTTTSFDSLNFAQTWNWSTATTHVPLTMNANGLTTGSILALKTSNVSLNSTAGLLNVANTGTSASGTVARIQSNSTAGSGLSVLANGNVGVGSATPATRLDVTQSGSGAVIAARFSGNPGATGNSNYNEIAINNTQGTNAQNTIAFQGNGSDRYYIQNDFTGAGQQNFAIYDAIGGQVRYWINANGNTAIGNSVNAQAALDVVSNGTIGSAVIVPRDSIANRPTTPVNGMIRYANDSSKLEAYVNGAWGNLASGAVGTVTTIATGTGLVGGAITTTGTIGVDVGTAASKIVQLNANAQIATSLGTAGLPSHSFAGNTTTGMYSPGANQLALVTSGTASVNLSAAGLLGLGTTTPSSLLDAYGSGSTAIGLAVTNTGGTGGAAIYMSAYGNASPFMQMNQARGTLASPTATQAGDNVGVWQAQGFGSSANVGGSLLISTAEAAFTNASGPTSLLFQTTGSGSASSTERVRITSAGRVGIGTSSPTNTLQLGSGAILAPETTATYSATLTINWTTANQQVVTLTGNTAITFSNYAAGQTLRLILCQDGTGSRTVTSWDANVVWTGGTAPVLTTTASKCDVLMFFATNAKGSLKMFGSSALNF